MNTDEIQVGDTIVAVLDDQTTITGVVFQKDGTNIYTQSGVKINPQEDTILTKVKSKSFRYDGTTPSYANLVYWASECGYLDIEMINTRTREVRIRTHGGREVYVSAGQTLRSTPNILYTEGESYGR